MIEKFVEGNSLPEVYHKALKELYWDGALTECPDWDCKQRELSMTIHIKEPMAEPMISKYFIGGPDELEQYREEMLDGILDFEVEKGNWSYTYHKRYSDQLPFIIEELTRNPYSRRAVMDIRTPDDIGSDDPACLQHIQFFIRDGRLDCSVLFRSNDACKATFMNAFALICLQEKIAIELGIPVGTYTHRANSFHCYEKDFNLLDSYVRRLYTDISPAYSYKDEWKELMEDVQPMIFEKVERLKNE